MSSVYEWLPEVLMGYRMVSCSICGKLRRVPEDVSTSVYCRECAYAVDADASQASEQPKATRVSSKPDSASHPRWLHLRVDDVVSVVLGMCLSTLIGLGIPDLDQSFLAGLLGTHRSLISHGFPAVALVIGWVVAKRAGVTRIDRAVSRPVWPVAAFAGLACGLLLHLTADLFPGDWRGYALLHYPGGREMSWLSSVTLLAANVVLAAGVLLRAKEILGGRHPWLATLVIVTASVAAFVYARSEGSLWLLVAFLVPLALVRATMNLLSRLNGCSG